MIDALLEAVLLKALPRSGWERKGVPDPESVAAHSWGVAWLTVVLLPEGLDRGRALTYAILHDLPEARTGDLTPEDGVSKPEKLRREIAALQGLLAVLPSRDRIEEIWRAYETRADEEAEFVHQLDRLDMALQAVVYAEAGHAGMREFMQSAAAEIYHPALVPVMDALSKRVRADHVFTKPPAPVRH